MISTIKYSQDTSVTVRSPWGFYISARVMCPDGIARNVKRISECADTFFSVPCSVTFKGKTIAGYMTFADTHPNDYNSTEQHVEFRPYQNRKNAHLFNGGK